MTMPQYFAVPLAFQASFARADAVGVALTVSRGASRFSVSREWTEIVGPWDARSFGVGGWSLSVLHAYDPESQILLLGNGRPATAPLPVHGTRRNPLPKAAQLQ